MQDSKTDGVENHAVSILLILFISSILIFEQTNHYF